MAYLDPPEGVVKFGCPSQGLSSSTSNIAYRFHHSPDAFAMSLAIDPSDSPSLRHERGDDDLEQLYVAALSDMEGLLDPKYVWKEDEAVSIEDMIVQFRIWGIELDIKSGTLRWLQDDYLKEAAAIRVNLQAVRSTLTRFISHMSREIEVEAEAKAKAETVNITDTWLEDTHL